MYIKLNARGREWLPHLSNEILKVYGYDALNDTFVIWDHIEYAWVDIPTTDCWGVNKNDS